MANKVLNQFIEYYRGLSQDAQEIVRDLILAPQQPAPKSQSPAPSVKRQSSSKKHGLPASGANSGVEMGNATSASNAGANGGD